MTAEATKIIAATPAAANTQQAPAAPAARGLEVDANVCLLTEPQSLAAEAVRSLRTQIVARHVDAGRRALAMVAPTAECGLTTLTLNLAIALAQTGVRTLLVDADQIGRAHVRTPVTNAHIVCRLLLAKIKKSA